MITVKDLILLLCYTNAVLNMKDSYPVFCQASIPKKYKGGEIVVGEYLVEHFKIEQLGGMIFQKQWLSHDGRVSLILNP